MTTHSLRDPLNPPFDRVEVEDDGAAMVLSYGEFMALQLALRIRLILAGRPRFWLGNAEIEKRKALSLA